MLEKFILNELRNVSRPLKEAILPQEVTDAVKTGFEFWAKDKSTSERRQINSQIIRLITNNFSGGFANHLLRSLQKNSRKSNMMILSIITNYLANPANPVNKDNLFELIGVPILEFFVQKTFGKDSFLSRIRQITPFMKKISTGNGQLDLAIYSGLSEALADPKVRNAFKKELLQNFIEPKISNLDSDQEFLGLFSEGEISEDILGIGGNIRNRIDRVRAAFSNRETKSKMTLMLNILKYLPYIKPDLKRSIREGLMDLSYDAVKNMLDRRDTTEASKVVSLVIMKYIIEKSKDLYFGDFLDGNVQKGFMDIVRDVFIAKPTIDHVSKAVSAFLREGINKAKEVERLKKQKQTKSKYK